MIPDSPTLLYGFRNKLRSLLAENWGFSRKGWNTFWWEEFLLHRGAFISANMSHWQVGWNQTYLSKAKAFQDSAQGGTYLVQKFAINRAHNLLSRACVVPPRPIPSPVKGTDPRWGDIARDKRKSLLENNVCKGSRSDKEWGIRDDLHESNTIALKFCPSGLLSKKKYAKCWKIIISWKQSDPSLQKSFKFNIFLMKEMGWEVGKWVSKRHGRSQMCWSNTVNDISSQMASEGDTGI